MFYVPAASVRKRFNQEKDTFNTFTSGLSADQIKTIGLGNLPKLPTNFIGVSDNECLRKGQYQGPEDRFTNCELMCGTADAVYKYIPEGSTVVFNEEILKPGGWCLPAEYTACNMSTSNVVWNRNGSWDCIPKYSLFGGSGNNQILGCNGKLRDVRKNILYENFIKPDTVITDLYETFTKDGKLQSVYQCAESRDHRENTLISDNLGNPFQLHEDYCRKFSYNVSPSIATTTYINDKASCRCNAPLYNLFGKPRMPCVSCPHGYNHIRNNTSFHKDSYMISMPCIDKLTRIDNIGLSKLPICGENNFEGTQSSCLTGNIIIIDSSTVPDEDKKKFQIEPTRLKYN